MAVRDSLASRRRRPVGVRTAPTGSRHHAPLPSHRGLGLSIPRRLAAAFMMGHFLAYWIEKPGRLLRIGPPEADPENFFILQTSIRRGADWHPGDWPRVFGVCRSPRSNSNTQGQDLTTGCSFRCGRWHFRVSPRGNAFPPHRRGRYGTSFPSRSTSGAAAAPYSIPFPQRPPFGRSRRERGPGRPDTEKSCGIPTLSRRRIGVVATRRRGLFVGGIIFHHPRRRYGGSDREMAALEGHFSYAAGPGTEGSPRRGCRRETVISIRAAASCGPRTFLLRSPQLRD